MTASEEHMAKLVSNSSSGFKSTIATTMLLASLGFSISGTDFPREVDDSIHIQESGEVSSNNPISISVSYSDVADELLRIYTSIGTETYEIDQDAQAVLYENLEELYL